MTLASAVAVEAADNGTATLGLALATVAVNKAAAKATTAAPVVDKGTTTATVALAELATAAGAVSITSAQQEQQY